MNTMDESFLAYASEILGETNSGLSGPKIVECCNTYAITFNRVIPHGGYPFDAPNKRTALRENLHAFDAVEQFRIIKELCDNPIFEGSESIKSLKQTLYKRYGNLATEKFGETQLVQTTKHWLSAYPDALKQYESALAKYEGGIYERNTLDDIRLSFELLVKEVLHNDKSLENQLGGIGRILDNAGVSVELKNMVHKIVDYYTKFQNNHVKHDDAINEIEIEFIIELTSVVMKFLIKAFSDG